MYLNTLQNIYDKGEGLDKVKRIIEQLQSASRKIESVIKRVMDFSKPTNPHCVMLDINRTINEVLKLSSVTMRKSGISLEKILADDLQPIYADANLIEEMVLNLLNNAAEAMKSMEKDKKIVVTISAENDFMIVRVSDTGPGVPLQIRDKIFDPYFTTRPEGTGIGLSLSHRIITDHGGSLTVSESDLGGAEFRIEIPMKK